MSNFNGKSRSQIVTEVFLVVNMAHLLYVAALCFYKMLIVSAGITIAEICAYRFGTLCAIEVMKVSCCNLFFCGIFEDDQRDRDSSPRCNEEGDLIEKETASVWYVSLLYLIQAILMTVAFLAVLIGIKTLPLSYFMMALYLTNALLNSLSNLKHITWRDSSTFIGLILATVTFTFAFCVAAILSAPKGTLQEKI